MCLGSSQEINTVKDGLFKEVVDDVQTLPSESTSGAVGSNLLGLQVAATRKIKHT